MPATLSEFDLIKAFFEGVGPKTDVVGLGVGDDCAVISIPSDKSLCISMDTMVEGIHFLPGSPPQKIAYRALAAAMSDLAAMGAEPSHFTLSLTLPVSNYEWLSEFSLGLKTLADQFHFPLVGGDTTKGPLTISLQVHGLIPTGQALMRSGAKVGDIIAVTGTLGDAGAALTILDRVDDKLLTDGQSFLLNRYYYPSPRIVQGLQLRLLASACIDISDGLLADASHIAEKSKVELEIDSESLPMSEALLVEQAGNACGFALSAGDDYELLFTISESNWEILSEQKTSHIYTKIGRVNEGSGVVVKNNIQSSKSMGYKHFE